MSEHLDMIEQMTPPGPAAGFMIRELHDLDEMLQANQLLDSIWAAEATNSHFDPALLKAMAHAGNYVVGVYDGERLVAACVGFFATPLGDSVHSHIAGVHPDYAGHGLGRSLKLHQRSWCLDRGIGTISWTFDPLVARNAYFNIARLGAHCTQYLENFYGAMKDKVNAGQPSDRMLVSWALSEPSPVQGPPQSAAGLPLALEVGQGQEPESTDVAGPRIAIGIPRNIEGIRPKDPLLLRRWRLALRSELTHRMDAGWRITGFDKSAFYILEGPSHED